VHTKPPSSTPGGGQTNSFKLGVKRHPWGGAASAVVAVVIIVAIIPTAPSVARASTTNIVVFWILTDFGLFCMKLRDIASSYPFGEKA
jgi:hypothetical protein